MNALKAIKLYATRAFPCLGYWFHLLRPPRSLIEEERQTLHRLLRLPPNTLTDCAIQSLKQRGIGRLPLIAIEAPAAMLRTATKTLPRWRDAERPLKPAAERYGSLAGWATGRLWPLHWDTEPMAKEIAETLDRRAPTSMVGRMTDEEVRAALESPAPQRAVVRCFDTKVDAQPFADLVARLAALAPGSQAPRLADARERLRQTTVHMLRPNHTLMVLRSILNGWATSARVGAERRRSCAFGCEDGDDTVAHYLRCEPL